ncbi:uncharacterized protein EV422DRAFT_547928 [Fimicolochytrium jonesii]|uniref:uncharacterized protein n=1 Tax=Fimicolochytrium jonesii TaxID=1396493 RepID=UPI0022FEDACB|nr:uncharacterized protein EV422DRAFT_547928 [Fimicolochytrium jonesii]KAI8815880.1 hypothetical protein EV422DRAFT_547928 [Fimicolochytrium jonesii]
MLSRSTLPPAHISFLCPDDVPFIDSGGVAYPALVTAATSSTSTVASTTSTASIATSAPVAPQTAPIASPTPQANGSSVNSTSLAQSPAGSDGKMSPVIGIGIGLFLGISLMLGGYFLYRRRQRRLKGQSPVPGSSNFTVHSVSPGFARRDTQLYQSRSRADEPPPLYDEPYVPPEAYMSSVPVACSPTPPNRGDSMVTHVPLADTKR